MSNNLYQEAQRDDWHGQIVGRPVDKFIFNGYRNIEEQLEHLQSRLPQWKRETEKSLAKLLELSHQNPWPLALSDRYGDKYASPRP